MRLILALVAASSLVACSHNSNNNEPQPGPETGQVSTDTGMTRAPIDTLQTTRTPAGTIDTSRAGSDTSMSHTSPPTSTTDTTFIGAQPGETHHADSAAGAPPDTSSIHPDTSSLRHDSL
jgi:hypothetical protein